MRIGMVTDLLPDSDNRPPLWWLQFERPALSLVKKESPARSGEKENAFAVAKGA